MEHYLISGRVQGVGYRVWCKSYLEKLGLSGWVRNLSDKRVEVVIFDEGLKSLAALKAALSKGPVFASVKSIQHKYIQYEAVNDDLLASGAEFAILATSDTALSHSHK